MISDTAITSILNHIKDTVSYAKYRVVNEYYRAEIVNASISADGSVSIEFVAGSDFDTVEDTITINEVQLFNEDDEMWFSADENISCIPVDESLLCKVKFTIEEV